MRRFVIEADDVARAIVKAVEEGQDEMTVPWFPYRLATIGQALVPGTLLAPRRSAAVAARHRGE